MTLQLNDQAGIWRCSLGAEDAALKWVRIDAIDQVKTRNHHAASMSDGFLMVFS